MLIKRDTWEPSLHAHVSKKGHTRTQKAVICMPRKEYLPETKSARTFILACQPPELWVINFSCLIQPVCALFYGGSNRLICVTSNNSFYFFIKNGIQLSPPEARLAFGTCLKPVECGSKNAPETFAVMCCEIPEVWSEEAMRFRLFSLNMAFYKHPLEVLCLRTQLSCSEEPKPHAEVVCGHKGTAESSLQVILFWVPDGSRWFQLSDSQATPKGLDPPSWSPGALSSRAMSDFFYYRICKHSKMADLSH